MAASRRQVTELLAEALEVAKHLIVDDAHKPEQLGSEFWSGVAVSPSFGADAEACFSVLALTLDGL